VAEIQFILSILSKIFAPSGFIFILQTRLKLGLRSGSMIPMEYDKDKVDDMVAFGRRAGVEV
jgi:hypothetical protein